MSLHFRRTLVYNFGPAGTDGPFEILRPAAMKMSNGAHVVFATPFDQCLINGLLFGSPYCGEDHGRTSH